MSTSTESKPYDGPGRDAAEAVCERAVADELLIHELGRLVGELAQALDVECKNRNAQESQPAQRRALLVAVRSHGAAGVVALVRDWLSVKPTKEQMEQALSQVMRKESGAVTFKEATNPRRVLDATALLTKAGLR